MDVHVWRCFSVAAILLQASFGKINGEDICWSTFGKFQYKVLTDVGGTNFSSAVSACERENTALVSVHSLEENQFLQAFAMSQIGVPVWIGLYRKGENMSWVDGSELNYICRNYKRKSYEESCVYIFQGWIEANCNDSELYFICKREVVEANTCVVTSTPVEVTSDSLSDILIGETESSSPQTDEAYKITTTYNYPNSEAKQSNYDGTASSSSQKGRTQATETYSVVKRLTESMNNEKTNSFEMSKYTKKTTYIPTLHNSIKISTEAHFHTVTNKKHVTLYVDDKEKPSRQTTVTNSNNDFEGMTPTWEETFEELLKDMTVKKKPVYHTREAENSTAIGSISILFLVAIVFGIVLLDISTIRNHWKMFQNNTKDFCSKCKKERQAKANDVLELVIITDE